MSVCMSAVLAGISELLIKYTGKYVKIYFNMKITFLHLKGMSSKLLISYSFSEITHNFLNNAKKYC